jgi:hypothetical protein
VNDTAIITDQDSLDLINASSIAKANATTAKDSPVNLTPLSIPVAIRHTEEGYLDLSAVNEGLITIERDGSFKDTPSSRSSSPPSTPARPSSGPS